MLKGTSSMVFYIHKWADKVKWIVDTGITQLEM